MKTALRFIVVDDDPINNMVCKYVITNFAPAAGIQLFTDPAKALQFIQNDHEADNQETVLFLDINMPVMSGWEFLDAYSSFEDKLHSQIKIIILSSSIDPEDIEQARNHPLVSGYFPKPLSKETLMKMNE
ncbi:response regulator [Dyadobacter sp. LJ53]|uniref:response regulator n=1 Tax=Dyadobacter chenwenxiniae TaxID=2906456 RepID=UPI001F1CF4A9|nr:response regulator [Dyadobacter chenwenxiniae]MCF0048494.1 response regulator [Dyadobacter chenwenxiniae]